MIGNLAGPVSMIINISNQKEDYDETFNVLDKTVFVKDIKTVKVRYEHEYEYEHEESFSYF